MTSKDINLHWDTNIINLDNVIAISRNNKQHILKYLNQFLELISERLLQLETSLEQDDRKLTRQILHKMSPQLQFFGIQNVMTPINRLEYEYNSMSKNELNNLVSKIIITLEEAINEVSKLKDSDFDS
ncbi:hypothetical protein [Psychroserpens sp. MEBiC05023]